jgi:hypothetical protein
MTTTTTTIGTNSTSGIWYPFPTPGGSAHRLLRPVSLSREGERHRLSVAGRTASISPDVSGQRGLPPAHAAPHNTPSGWATDTRLAIWASRQRGLIDGSGASPPKAAALHPNRSARIRGLPRPDAGAVGTTVSFFALPLSVALRSTGRTTLGCQWERQVRVSGSATVVSIPGNDLGLRPAATKPAAPCRRRVSSGYTSIAAPDAAATTDASPDCRITTSARHAMLHLPEYGGGHRSSRSPWPTSSAASSSVADQLAMRRRRSPPAAPPMSATKARHDVEHRCHSGRAVMPPHAKDLRQN